MTGTMGGRTGLPRHAVLFDVAFSRHHSFPLVLECAGDLRPGAITRLAFLSSASVDARASVL